MKKEKKKAKTKELIQKLYSTCAILSLCCALCACSATTANDAFTDSSVENFSDSDSVDNDKTTSGTGSKESSTDNTVVSDEATSKSDSDTNATAAPAKRKSRNRKKTEELPKKEYSPVMTEKEKGSVQIGTLSTDHPYYQEVIGIDHECADYIKEISIYDEEINDTFIVHVSLPPNYDESKEYPFVVMTDGVWRLSDHPELRPLMEDNQIEDVVLVSIGYPNDYDYESIRERDLVKDPYSFLHFIVDNLIPCLKENYSLSDENTTFTGHSYGGYFAFFTLFHSDDIAKGTFENYYIGSPSFQAYTGTSFIKDHEKQYFERTQSLPANVYITVGGDENDQMKNNAESFIEVLEERNYEGLTISYEIIDGYDHNTVFKPSIKNTLLRFYSVEN